MILMRQSTADFEDLEINWILGCPEVVDAMEEIPAQTPFNEEIKSFLNTLSGVLRKDERTKQYSDVATFAFWIRHSSVDQIKRRYYTVNDSIVLGRGTVFHIAPSNVPVNFAYSLVTGLLCGNRNIVRIPSKDFEQVRIICDAMKETVKIYPDMGKYIALVRYGHDESINAAFSAVADVRVVWGGDTTINEIRKASLKPRATEVTFADRFSLAVIDADYYLEKCKADIVAKDFYNDTYFTDQNACTAPRIVVWLGKRVAEAQEVFWSALHELVQGKYDVSAVQAIDKLTNEMLYAAVCNGIVELPGKDNLVNRVRIDEITDDLGLYFGNSGLFFEYEAGSILELKALCSKDKCQTLSYIGNVDAIMPLLQSGIQGIDRVVPVGRTMDFDLTWDGYNLFERLTRRILILS